MYLKMKDYGQAMIKLAQIESIEGNEQFYNLSKCIYRCEILLQIDYLDCFTSLNIILPKII
jgi:hypothetical protein